MKNLKLCIIVLCVIVLATVSPTQATIYSGTYLETFDSDIGTWDRFDWVAGSFTDEADTDSDGYPDSVTFTSGSLKMDEAYQGAAAHLEFDGVQTDNGVRLDVSMNQGVVPSNVENWGMSVGIYYDTDNWVRLNRVRDNGGGYIRYSKIDGGSITSDHGITGYYDSWHMQGIELTDTKIKFHASPLTFGSEGNTAFDENMTLDMDDMEMNRPASFTGEATLLVGKGWIDVNGDPWDSLWDLTETEPHYIDSTRIQIGENNDPNVITWDMDPYENFLKTAAPDAGAPEANSITVKMAKGEYRDALFMISAASGPDDTIVDINVTSASLPSDAILVQETLYILSKPASGPDQITGDAVRPLIGDLTIPSGQSRQVRLRFNTRDSGVAAGTYSFSVILTDVNTSGVEVIDGNLVVWDFNLPSTDEVPNNTYASIKGTNWSGASLTNAVQEMKRYGLNYMFIAHTELPQATDVNVTTGEIITMNYNSFDYRISSPNVAWLAGDGDETQNFILYLGDLTLGQTGPNQITYPGELWNTLFGNWIDAMATRLQNNFNLGYDRWLMTLGDEEGSSTLTTYTIPLAETITTIDPNLRLICNSGSIVDDANAARYYAVFDVLQTNMDKCEADANVMTFYTDPNINELWSHKVAGYFGGIGADLYRYYRTYSWRMDSYGMTGLGLWTYGSGSGAPYDWYPYNPNGIQVSAGDMLVWRFWDSNEVFHSRRYEMYRETVDDYRYILKLLDAAYARGGSAPATADTLIDDAETAIIADNNDHTLCDYWREQIAEKTLEFLAPSSSTVYNFVGVTQSTNDHYAYACDVDSFPFGGNQNNRNSFPEASNTQYGYIDTDDTDEWIAPGAGGGDERLLWIQMDINEAPANITQIDLTFNGNSSSTINHRIYVKDDSTAWEETSAWTQLGSDLSITANTDTEMTRSITSNFADYIDGSGNIIWAVSQRSANKALNTNYIQMVVHYTE